MALKATIFKAELNIADLDRHYYADHSLTIARHPSETDERMMLRVAVFALFGDQQLSFTKGLSSDEEPDLWQTSLAGEIEHWIDLGLPDEKRIRKACGRAQKVTVCCYGGNPAEHWFEKNKTQLARFKQLTVINISVEASQALAAIAERTMNLQCTIQDQQLFINNGAQSLTISFEQWF